MDLEHDYKEIINKSTIESSSTSTYNIFNIDEFLNNLLSNLNPILSGFIKSLIVLISFMTFPLIVLLMISADSSHDLIDIFDVDNKKPHVVLFRNSAIITLLYISTIFFTILFDNLVNILTFFCYILNIRIKSKTINIFSIINQSAYYLRNSTIAFICFIISYMWSGYKFFSKKHSIGNIRTTLFFIATIYFFFMFLLKLFFNIIASNAKKNIYRDRIRKNNLNTFIFERLIAYFKGLRTDNIKLSKYDSGSFLRPSKLNFDIYTHRKHFAKKYFSEDILLPKLKIIFPRRFEYIKSYFGIEGQAYLSREIIQKQYIIFSSENINITQSIHSQNSIYEKLYVLIKVISFFLFIILLMIFLNLNYKVYLASIAPIIAGISWIFKDTIKEMYDCFKFHLIDNNYDVGDRVIIKGEDLRVKTIDLFGTEFLNYNNRVVYYSTTNLFPLKIDNINRSQNQIEEVVIDISDQTPYSDIIELRNRIKEECKANEMDFTGNVFIRNLSVYLNNLIIRIAIEHRSNFQNLKERLKRREKAIIIIEKAMRNLKIAYSNDFICKD